MQPETLSVKVLLTLSTERVKLESCSAGEASLIIHLDLEMSIKLVHECAVVVYNCV